MIVTTATVLAIAFAVMTTAFDTASFTRNERRRCPCHYFDHAVINSDGRRSDNRALRTKLFAIEVSSLLAPSSSSSSSASHEILLLSPQILAASFSSIITYLSLIAYYDRPRGSFAISQPKLSLSIQPSNVPNGGLGLFTTRRMTSGTILGTYPGVLRPARQFYDGKCIQYPKAIGYSWRFTDNEYVLDPTDSYGELHHVCYGGSDAISTFIYSTLFHSWTTSTELCRINEPPLGVGGCSITAREDLRKREVMFELTKDVEAGQELYLDYGLNYDRSSYGRPANP